jgi:hypothetical protein
MRANPGDRWIFRWRFEYANGTSRAGIWNGTTRFEDTASAQTKEGLIAAIIEGKHFMRRDIRIFAECPGQDFINFEHLAVHVRSPKSSTTFVYGMRIRTRNCMANCFADGSIEKHDWRPDSNYRWPEWTRT